MTWVLLLLAVLVGRFDVKGYVTGFGSTSWKRTHEEATKTAVAVTALLKNGATCVGKTVLDELSFGFVVYFSFDFTCVFEIKRYFIFLWDETIFNFIKILLVCALSAEIAIYWLQTWLLVQCNGEMSLLQWMNVLILFIYFYFQNNWWEHGFWKPGKSSLAITYTRRIF